MKLFEGGAVLIVLEDIQDPAICHSFLHNSQHDSF